MKRGSKYHKSSRKSPPFSANDFPEDTKAVGNDGKVYITKMMDNDHATGMMVDELVNAAANDTILAGKLSDMISRYPDLMLLTTHHFMPVIANDSLLSDTFCDHTLEHKDLEKAMHNKMEYKKSMEKNH